MKQELESKSASGKPWTQVKKWTLYLHRSYGPCVMDHGTFFHINNIWVHYEEST